MAGTAVDFLYAPPFFLRNSRKTKKISTVTPQITVLHTLQGNVCLRKLGKAFFDPGIAIFDHKDIPYTERKFVSYINDKV